MHILCGYTQVSFIITILCLIMFFPSNNYFSFITVDKVIRIASMHISHLHRTAPYCQAWNENKYTVYSLYLSCLGVSNIKTILKPSVTEMFSSFISIAVVVLDESKYQHHLHINNSLDKRLSWCWHYLCSSYAELFDTWKTSRFYTWTAKYWALKMYRTVSMDLLFFLHLYCFVKLYNKTTSSPELTNPYWIYYTRGWRLIIQ